MAPIIQNPRSQRAAKTSPNPALNPLGTVGTPDMHDYFGTLTPQAQLAFLLHNGYKVQGGVGGTQFKTASKAYGKNIGGDYWTKVATKNQAARLAAIRAAKAHASAISAHDPNAVTVPVGGPSSYTDTSAIDTSAIDMPTLASLGISMKGLNYKGMDPAKLATSMVNSQYNPQIVGLATELTNARNQGTQAQKDIKEWYAALASDLAATTQADKDAQTAVLADHDAGQQGILNVLGGNAGAANSAAAFGAINRGALEKIGLSRQDYDAALAPAFTSQRNDAALSQLNKDASAQEALLNQLTALRSAKGQAYAGAFSQAMDNNFKNQVASVNAKAQLAMLPAQVAQAKAGVATTNANLKMAGLQYNAQVLKNQTLGDQANGPVPKFGKLNPEQLTGLQNQLLSQAVDAHDPMKLAHNPADVYKAWKAALRGMSGGQWDTKTSGMVSSWVNNLLGSRLPQWNRTHPKQQYRFQNGVLVKK